MSDGDEFAAIQSNAEPLRRSDNRVVAPGRDVSLGVPTFHGGRRDVAELRGHRPDAPELLENARQLPPSCEVRFPNHNRTSSVRQSHSLGATPSPKLRRMDSRQIIAALKELRVPHERIAEVIGRDRSAATKMLGGKRSVKVNEVEGLTALIAEYRQGGAELPREPAPPARPAKDPSTGPMNVLGEVRAGAWLEADSDQRTPETYPAAPDARYPAAAQHLMRVRGDSMDAATKAGQPAGILDGDLVHVVDAITMRYEFATGDIVVVERSRFDGREREITLKQVEVLPNAEVLLWPRSSNPRWKDPVPYKENGNEVRVSGKVIQVLRQWG